MKTKTLLIAIICIITSQISWGQTHGQIQISPTDQIVCPNSSMVYRLEKYNSYQSSWEAYQPTGNWTITGGTTNGYIGGLGQITVSWNDGVEQGTIKAEWTENNVISNRINTVTINSITHKTPSAILPTSSIQMGEVQQTYYLDAANWMKYPDNYFVNDYEWIFPAGWRIGNSVSDGERPLYSGSDQTVTVTTNATSGGVIKVAGISKCTSGGKSKYQTITISRVFPSDLAITTTTSNDYLQGNKTPITYSVPSWSSATYSWSKPATWQYQGSSTSPTVTLIPDGCLGGNVSCKITIPATAQSKTVPETVNNFSPYPAGTVPFINGNNQVCTSGVSYSLGNIPARTTSYFWSTDANLTVASGQGTANITVGTSGIGTANLQATISVGGCTPVSFQKQAWVGKPSIPVTTPNGTYEIGLGSQFSAWINSSPGASSSTGSWSSKWAVALNDDPTGSSCLFEAVSLGKGVIYVTTSNACGISPQKAIPVNVTSGGVMYAISPNPATSFITVEQLTTEEVTSRSAQATEDVTTLSTLSSENNIESSSVSATSEEAFTVEIWHEKKGKVKTVKSNKKLETIDVSGLDKGNYFLHIITPTATYKEHILIE